MSPDTPTETKQYESSGNNTENIHEELNELEEEGAEKDTSINEETQYNITGDDAIVIDGTEIEELNITKIGGNVIAIAADLIKSPKDQRFSCPYCFTELEVKEYGKHKCKFCERTFFLDNPERNRDIILYKTLTPEEAKTFNKLTAHITNSIQDKNYSRAYQYCRKAEELAPGEVSTWRYFAITEFLLEINKDSRERKTTDFIIRKIKSHIEKCKDHGITEEEYESLVVDIANRLFNIEKARLNSVQPQYRDKFNNPKWSKGNFTYLLTFLRSFEICYALYPDTLFLEGYLNELKKDYKWIFKTTNGELVNNPACTPFNAVRKLEFLDKELKAKKADYCSPVIAEERFTIKNVFSFKINAVTTKTDT